MGPHNFLGPCIPNFYPKFWVEFRVGTSFRKSRRDELNVIFSLFSVKDYYRNSRKQIFAIFSRKIAIFASSETFGKHGNYQNISEIRNTAIYETRENENFGKKRLSQGPTIFAPAYVCCCPFKCLRDIEKKFKIVSIYFLYQIVTSN